MAASLVQKLGTASGAAPKTVTIPVSGVPIGDLVVVFVGSDAASDPTTVTDTGGNTYTKAISSQIQTGAGLWFSRLTVALVSGNTVSVNGYTGNSAIGMSQFTGILTSPQDKTQSANAASGTALASGTTTATAQANELHCACWGLNINNATSTPGGTFSILDTFASATVSLVSEYRILTSTGTQTATATGGATAAWDGVQATFKATASTGVDPKTFNPVPFIPQGRNF